MKQSTSARLNVMRPAATRVLLGTAIGLACSGMIAFPTVAVENSAVDTTAEFWVSRGNPTRRHLEVTACSDPDREDGMLVASMYSDNGELLSRSSYMAHRNVVLYRSDDRGRSWQTVLDLPSTVDPACAFDTNGVAYFAVMNFLPGESLYRGVRLYRSDDHGATWSLRSVIGADDSLDRPWLAIDGTKGSMRGRLYVTAYGHWMDEDQRYIRRRALRVFYSDDRADTFVAVEPKDVEEVVHNGTIEVLSDGRLVSSHFAFPVPQPRANSEVDCRDQRHPGSARIVLWRASDRILPPPTTVSRGLTQYPCRPKPSADHIPALGVHRRHGIEPDRLYVAWTDLRSGRAETWFSHSGDHGVTWSAATPLNDDSPFRWDRPWEGPHVINPSLAVSDQGVVGAFWYDRRDNPERGYWPRFSASLDGGYTWTPSRRVSSRPYADRDRFEWSVNFLRPWEEEGMPRGPQPIRLSFGAAQPLLRTGDTSGLTVGRDGTFRAFWIDDRTGVKQVFGAGIMVKGGVIPLVDLTDKVRLELVGYQHEPSTGVVSVEIRLQNTSKAPLGGPLRLQISRLPTSGSGHQIYAVNSDNIRQGQGASWEMLREGDVVAAGQTSRSRNLELRYTSGSVGAVRTRLIDMNLRVVGRAVESEKRR